LALICCVACTPAPRQGLTVAAAANVQFAFQEIGERFEAETGIPVSFVYGATGTLARQIENGAPYDVLAAADTASLAQLTTQDLVRADDQTVYARGRLALVANRASEFHGVTLDDLATSEGVRIAIANPDHAPYGRAARQTLVAVGLWETLEEEARVVRAGNVRQALQFVEIGDAPLGLVSLSIADVPGVSYALVPAYLHEPIDQAIGVTARSAQVGAARRFVAFVTGPEGKTILERYGYQTDFSSE
jgi:molybdate transport system substrate-binding protein